jgi:uncharacterized peroxidase-related enzyme
MAAMSILHTIPEDEATGLVKELYDEDREDLGYIPSHSRVMAMNPEAVRAFENLARAITRQMDKRRYELVTLAAAGAIGSRACLLAHSNFSLRYMDEDTIVRVLADYHAAGLTEAEVTMMDFARKVSSDSAAMTDVDSQALRDAGFDDREIVDIALTAALRNYYSRALHALAVEVDVPPTLPESIVAAIS